MFGPNGTPVIDTFNRADESPAVGWPSYTGAATACSIVSNRLSHPGSDGWSYYSGASYAANQEMWCEFGSVGTTTSHSVQLYLRNVAQGTSGVDGYTLRQQVLSGATQHRFGIYRVTNASEVLISSAVDVAALAAGDFVAFVARGTALTGYTYRAASPGWTSVVTVADSTYTAGGVLGVYLTGFTLENAGGGTLPAGLPGVTTLARRRRR